MKKLKKGYLGTIFRVLEQMEGEELEEWVRYSLRRIRDGITKKAVADIIDKAEELLDRREPEETIIDKIIVVIMSILTQFGNKISHIVSLYSREGEVRFYFSQDVGKKCMKEMISAFPKYGLDVETEHDFYSKELFVQYTDKADGWLRKWTRLEIERIAALPEGIAESLKVNVPIEYIEEAGLKNKLEECVKDRLANKFDVSPEGYHLDNWSISVDATKFEKRKEPRKPTKPEFEALREWYDIYTGRAANVSRGEVVVLDEYLEDSELYTGSMILVKPKGNIKAYRVFNYVNGNLLNPQQIPKK